MFHCKKKFCMSQHVTNSRIAVNTLFSRWYNTWVTKLLYIVKPATIKVVLNVFQSQKLHLNFMWKSCSEKRKMDHSLTPIAPSTSTAGRVAVESKPYQPSDFWETVKILRQTMYRILSWSPELHDLPRRGGNRELDKRVQLFIDRHYGKKVSFKPLLVQFLKFLF